MREWRTRGGEKVPVSGMDDSHLLNAIRYVERNEEELRHKAAFRLDCAAGLTGGELASDQLEDMALTLYEGDIEIHEWMEGYGWLVDEAERRELSW